MRLPVSKPGRLASFRHATHNHSQRYGTMTPWPEPICPNYVCFPWEGTALTQYLRSRNLLEGLGASRRVRLPSAKRRASALNRLHSWFPYYAGFSPEFVRQALSELELSAGAVVLDPMNGSGTTTVVAQELGHCAIGFDLNPAMAWIAGAKDASAAHWEALDALLAEVILKPLPSGKLPDVAKTWMSASAYHRLASLVSTDSSVIEETRWAEPLRDLVSSIDLTSGRHSLLPACALLSVRTLGLPTLRSNPTWFGPPIRRKRELLKIDNVLTRRMETMKADLAATFTRPTERRLAVGIADARQLPLADGCIDVVVSSPPYLTRLDYAISTAPELALLGTDGWSRSDPLRRKLIGSTVTRGFESDEEALECKPVLDVLAKIKAHHSKASDGYYRRFFENYFHDVQQLLRELFRVLKKGGAAILVVQDSWYKDIHVPLGSLYLNMASTVGLNGSVVRSELVRQNFIRINAQAAVYTKGDVHEHTLLVRRS
jgi:SAM-dependent methyltransferase